MYNILFHIVTICKLKIRWKHTTKYHTNYRYWLASITSHFSGEVLYKYCKEIINWRVSILSNIELEGRVQNSLDVYLTYQGLAWKKIKNMENFKAGMGLNHNVLYTYSWKQFFFFFLIFLIKPLWYLTIACLGEFIFIGLLDLVKNITVFRKRWSFEKLYISQINWISGQIELC